jgi:hypothetical protein
VLGDLEADPALQPSDRPLEPGVLERLDSAALLADDVVVVLAGRLDPLVARHATAHLEPVHQLQLLQLLQGPIDAGAADRLVRGAQPIVDLDRGHRTVLARQQLDHREARAAPLVPGVPKRRDCVLDPGAVAVGPHRVDRSAGHYGISSTVIGSLLRRPKAAAR